jgi:kynurenine formamidase
MTFPYKLIDLTHALDPTIPTWNAGCGFNHDVYIDYSDCVGEDKFRVMNIKMHAGIGTHMDAPSHCIAGGKCIDDFALNELIFPCVVIDVSEQCFERYSLSVQDIWDFENSFGPIPAGSCVMIQTGWSQFWHTPLKYHNNHVFPSVSRQAAERLLERGVSALGIDTLSPDRPKDGFNVHQIFLGAGKILIENVANLDNMPPIGSFVMVMPMKIKAGTEAPVRLVGWRNHSFTKQVLDFIPII